MSAKRKTQHRWSEKRKRELLALTRKHGAVAAKVVDADSVEIGNWVRMKCRFGCSGWNRRLTCPPHSPTPAETRVMIDEYERGILFETELGASPSQIAAAVEREAFLMGYYKAFGFGAGPCHLCEECPENAVCRRPGDRRPAMEACGIDVFATARNNGFKIEVLTSHDQPGRCFGLVMLY